MSTGTDATLRYEVSHQCADQPPSRVKLLPFAIPAVGPHSQVTRSATSDGSASRLTALSARKIFSTTSSSLIPCVLAWSAICLSTKAVRTYPGLTQTLVTPL